MCSNPTILNQYFDRRRSLGVGFAFSGSGFGGIVAPLLINYAVNQFGLRITFIILAAAVLQVVVLASFYRPLTYWTAGKKPDSITVLENVNGNEKYSSAAVKSCLISLCDLRLLKNYRFTLFAAAVALITPMALVGFVMPPHCATLNISSDDVAILVSIQSKQL